MMKGGDGRIKEILKETILALLNNGVEFSSELQVDGLLGVTVDQKDVFLVKISEVVPSLKRQLAGHAPSGHGDSSDEDLGLKSQSSLSSKGQRRKRRSPSPKQNMGGKGDKRPRVASPTQAIPSSTSTKDMVKSESQDYGVDIDLTSVKMEPVDTTVADSNQSADFDFNPQQQQNHPAVITSIQSVAESDWQQGNVPNQQEMANAQLQQQVRASLLLFWKSSSSEHFTVKFTKLIILMVECYWLPDTDSLGQPHSVTAF